MSTINHTINRIWFKNQLRKGNLLVKCKGKYTDDYAYDNHTKFSRDTDFKVAKEDLFDDWYLSEIKIWGDKEGEISVSFAFCEFYTFKVAKS